MKVLVIGGGGREHALAWKIARSPEVSEVICAPGNPGMAQLGRCIPLKPTDIDGIRALCKSEGVGLAVVGPESPLIAGLADALRADGVPTFGPGADGAQLEGSKVFSKELFRKYGIPSARFEAFDDADAAEAAARAWNGPVVVKADGEAAGKGVLMCATPNEAVAAVDAVMRKRAFGDAGRRIVLEEWLQGTEMSLFALCDGKSILPFQTAQDYKRALDGDAGPNTGGMGAVSPVPFVTPVMLQAAVEEVLLPTVKALQAEGIDYRGCLYAGLMWTADGWKLLEYNCRFGDPETQPLLCRMESDLFPLLLDCAQGDLGHRTIAWTPGPAACIVVAAGGYPGAYEKGAVIRGLKLAAEIEGVEIFHAGTANNDQGLIVTNGGRVLNVVATGQNYNAALERAYEAVELLGFTGMQYRTDIGRNLSGTIE
ncbi:MAG TPA: phosphoribosylamine--glycine ligase [Armatimonadota bacterium]|jgi:phosphoribosylamine--glycine ligase